MGSKAWVTTALLVGVGGGASWYFGPNMTSQVNAAYDVRQSEKQGLTHTVDGPMISDGPYHLAIRYGAGTLSKLVEESVKRKMTKSPPSIDSSGMGAKMALSPMTVVSTRVTFPKKASGVMVATVKLKGTLTVEPVMRRRRGETRIVPIYPTAVVRVRMDADDSQGRPALRVRLLKVTSFNLGVTGFPFPRIQEKIRSQIHQKVEKQLTDPSNPQSERLMALPEKLGKGDVALVAAGVTLVPGDDGEMFLGLVTNLNAEPQLTAELRGAPLDGRDWGMSLGDNTLSVMLGEMAQQGKIPSRFSRLGEPDPTGSVVFDIERADLRPGGFTLRSRIWNLGFPAFWRHFDIEGEMTFGENGLNPGIAGMVAGEGEGNVWLGEIIESRSKDAPQKTMASSGKKAPRRMPLPMTDGERVLQLSAETVVTGDHWMTILGSSDVLDAE